jgi:hypothetical protein
MLRNCRSRASLQVSGQVVSNPKVPVVAPGALVSSADFASAPALGLLVSIFGSALADGSAGDSGLPLPPQLGSTSVVLAGRTLPLSYVSDTRGNVAIPYDVPVNTTQQLVVLRGNAVSAPVPLAMFASEPSILSTFRTVNRGRIGQGRDRTIERCQDPGTSKLRLSNDAEWLTAQSWSKFRWRRFHFDFRIGCNGRHAPNARVARRARRHRAVSCNGPCQDCRRFISVMLRFENRRRLRPACRASRYGACDVLRVPPNP